ncbi:hypothetical protein PH5382_02566 [Phaeobacter sp. CECT 5382]|uniref:hypothetical protein n=1 Tax=Rhodobacterales TaxID=204455 RepID=UPI0006D9E703|nr:hypothetical protein [Phaeobacter sp. CECT 5382]CUH88627.1 hypothetical protein PH5382_02566 [Phaeobacter sp. CECT 5382]
MLLSKLLAENPALDDFWSLERCVSATARSYPDDEDIRLRFDVEPEYRSTPRKWQVILTAACERGLRAREDSTPY